MRRRGTTVQAVREDVHQQGSLREPHADGLDRARFFHDQRDGRQPNGLVVISALPDREIRSVGIKGHGQFDRDFHKSERGVLGEASPFGIRAVDDGVVVAVAIEDEGSVEGKGPFLASEAVADGRIEADDKTTDNRTNKCRRSREG
jgi:hypothetical protein